MTYIRVSTMTPLAGHEDEASRVNKELVEFYREQAGCLSAHFILTADASGEQGRITFWTSEHAAEEAAALEHSLHLRSRLHNVVQEGRQERSFTAAGAPAEATI